MNCHRNLYIAGIHGICLLWIFMSIGLVNGCDDDRWPASGYVVRDPVAGPADPPDASWHTMAVTRSTAFSFRNGLPQTTTYVPVLRHNRPPVRDVRPVCVMAPQRQRYVGCPKPKPCPKCEEDNQRTRTRCDDLLLQVGLVWERAKTTNVHIPCLWLKSWPKSKEKWTVFSKSLRPA